MAATDKLRNNMDDNTDKRIVGELIDLIGTIGLSDEESKKRHSRKILRVFFRLVCRCRRKERRTILHSTINCQGFS